MGSWRTLSPLFFRKNNRDYDANLHVDKPVIWRYYLKNLISSMDWRWEAQKIVNISIMGNKFVHMKIFTVVGVQIEIDRHISHLL